MASNPPGSGGQPPPPTPQPPSPPDVGGRKAPKDKKDRHGHRAIER